MLGDSGMFRISTAGREPIRIKLRTDLLFNAEDVFPGFSIELSVHPDEIEFQELIQTFIFFPVSSLPPLKF